jgi:hypothetical protein
MDVVVVDGIVVSRMTLEESPQRPRVFASPPVACKAAQRAAARLFVGDKTAPAAESLKGSGELHDGLGSAETSVESRLAAEKYLHIKRETIWIAFVSCTRFADE